MFAKPTTWAFKKNVSICYKSISHCGPSILFLLRLVYAHINVCTSFIKGLSLIPLLGTLQHVNFTSPILIIRKFHVASLWTACLWLEVLIMFYSFFFFYRFFFLMVFMGFAKNELLVGMHTVYWQKSNKCCNGQRWSVTPHYSNCMRWSQKGILLCNP